MGLVAFVFGSCIIAGASIKNVRAGDWRLSVNTADGTVTLGKGARNVIVGSRAEWGIDSIRRDISDCGKIKVSTTANNDIFGNGTVVMLTGTGGGETIVQRFYLYHDKDYVLTDFTIGAPGGVELNYMALSHVRATTYCLSLMTMMLGCATN